MRVRSVALTVLLVMTAPALAEDALLPTSRLPPLHFKKPVAAAATLMPHVAQPAVRTLQAPQDLQAPRDKTLRVGDITITPGGFLEVGTASAVHP